VRPRRMGCVIPGHEQLAAAEDLANRGYAMSHLGIGNRRELIDYGEDALAVFQQRFLRALTHGIPGVAELLDELADARFAGWIGCIAVGNGRTRGKHETDNPCRVHDKPRLRLAFAASCRETGPTRGRDAATGEQSSASGFSERSDSA